MNNVLLRTALLFTVFFALIALVGKAVAQSWLGGQGSASSTIALIPVEGVITGGSGSPGLLAMEAGASSVYLAALLQDAADDPNVKAVVLRVNSPGGSAAASDEIFRAVQDCREHKPVVVSMGDVAASGGYYVAAAADYIFANGATLTGSIGVLFNLFSIEELAENIGIRDETVTAGEFKDIGSPWRSVSEAEREMFKVLVDDVHDQFIAAVAEGRTNLSEEQVRELANGSVFTGAQAAGNGLVDEVGGLEAAADKARSLAGVDPATPLQPFAEEASLLEQLLSIRFEHQLLLEGLPFSDDPLMTLARGMYLSSALQRLNTR